MPDYDAVIVGAGPAGSVAALVLARAGARVALVDRRAFPRDKACGDLIGPRGVQLLEDLGIDVPGARRLGDMVIEGPSGRRTLLPALPGRDYADHALAVSRLQFDELLVEAAASAGARLVQGRAVGVPTGPARYPDGVRLADGQLLPADFVIGADGATSAVARAAGLVDDSRILSAFALRCYLDEPVDLPQIVLWEPTRWDLFPGYGWVFPTADGSANVGLGLGLPGQRSASRRAGEQLDAFLRHLVRQRLVDTTRHGRVLGGWLKLGLIGTIPVRDRVLLVGDAAGLVNPLQGEGIAAAMASGRAAAQAVLDDPARAGPGYLRALAALTEHQRSTAALHKAMMRHLRLVSGVGRLLTLPGVRRAVGGGWGLYWNDLVHSADPTPHRAVGTAIAGLTDAAARRGQTHRWFASHLDAAAERSDERIEETVVTRPRNTS